MESPYPWHTVCDSLTHPFTHSLTQSINQPITLCTLHKVDGLFNDSASSSDDILLHFGMSSIQGIGKKTKEGPCTISGIVPAIGKWGAERAQLVYLLGYRTGLSGFRIPVGVKKVFFSLQFSDYLWGPPSLPLN